jgi:Ca-activated chloride channel homolog
MCWSAWRMSAMTIALTFALTGAAISQSGGGDNQTPSQPTTGSTPGAGTQTGAQSGQSGTGQQPAAPPQNPAAGQQPPAQEAPSNQGLTPDQDAGTFVFRKQVDEVVLHATVVDDHGQLQAHLDRNAFSVFEDGRSQTISSFRRQDVPVAMGIVVDNSGSMRDKRDEVNRAVVNLIRASNPQDEVFVVNFSENSYLDQDFTSNIDLLERALNQTTMKGSTALYDAIVASARHLENNPRLDKKVLLVITDGEDNMSRETLEEARQVLQQKDGATLYAVGLVGQEARGRQALQQLAEATGGAALFPASMAQVSDFTQELAHDIRNQYVIAYTPHGQDAGANYHPIKVVASAPGYGPLLVRTRSGIYTGESVR